MISINTPLSEKTYRVLVRVSLDFPPSNFEPVLDTCKRWIADTYKKSMGKPILPAILQADANEFTPPGHCFNWLSITSPADGVLKLFSAKIEHPHEGGGWTWSVEVELAQTESKVIFGLRLAVFGLNVNDAPQSTPRLAKDLARRGATHEGVPLEWSGREIANQSDIAQLAKFVKNPHRVMPLIIISEIGNTGTWPTSLPDLARATQGIAIVVAMRDSATYLWRDQIEPRFNVFGGATRVYRPVLGPNLYAPIYLLNEKIANPTQTVEVWAINQVLDSSIRSLAWVDRHASYETASRLKASLVRQELINSAKASHDIAPLIEAYEEEILSLKQKLEDEKKIFREWAGEYDSVNEDYAELEHEYRSLLYRHDSLIAKLNQSASVEEEGSKKHPETLAEFRDWYDSSKFTERLFIAPKALRAVQQSNYENPELVYLAVKLLANEYHASKQENSDASTRQRFADGIAKLGITQEFAGGQTTLSRKEYEVLYDGRKIITDLHLLKGGGRDTRFCLRIYFAWDDQTKKCLIGWMPTHLDNTLS